MKMEIYKGKIYLKSYKNFSKEYYSGNQIKSEGKYDKISHDKIGKWQFTLKMVN